MKRILSLVLILILSVSVLTACEMPPQVQDFLASLGIGTPSVSYDLDNAKSTLRELYPNLLPTKETPVPSTIANFNVTKVLTCADGKYTVTWSANTESVKIVDYQPKDENDIFSAETTSTVKVILDSEDVNYVLTATITAPDNTTAVVDFSLVIPKLDCNTHEEYMAAAKGEEVMVKGIVVAINAKSLGNKYNHVFLADTDVVGGYYCYSITEDPAELGIKVGMTVAVSGPIEPYSGMQEIKGGQVVILDDTIKTVEPLDITDKFISGADLGAYVGLPVTIKGVELGGQELENATSQYLWFSIGESKGYVRTYVTDFAVGSSAAEMESLKAAIDADHAAHFGFKADATGILILYNGAPYLVPMSATPFTNYVEVIKTDAEKVASEKETLKVQTSFTADGEMKLPLVGVNYDDVTIAWTSDSEYVVIAADGTAKVTVPDTKTVVKLTATLTCGEVTETVEIEVTLNKKALTAGEAIEIGAAMEHNTYTIGKYLIAGVITEVYNETYGNMKITDEFGNVLTVYGTYSADGKVRYDAMETKPVVGDYVVLLGILGQYNDVAQTKNAWILSWTTPTDIPAANEIGTANPNYTADKHLITGTVTEVANTKYGNLYIEDAEGNKLYIYGLYDQLGNRYDAMTKAPAVGDTITVLTVLGAYNGAPQAKNATLVAHTPAQGGEGGEGGEDGGEEEESGPLTSLKTGDQVVIVAPAYNMALSATKIATYYNVGVDVSAGFGSITDAEIWVVTVNGDGSYTFTSLTGKVLAMAADYSSLNEEGENKSWALEAKDGAEGIFYLKNTVRGNYLEWYASKNNWSTYGTSDLSDLFELSFYRPTDATVGGGETGGETGGEGGEGGETTGPVEMTIPEVLAAAQGTEVIVKGTVVGFYETWNSQYGNCSPYIEDENGNRLLVFRTKVSVAEGDIVTVTGTVGAYNDVNQIAAGAAVEITGHVEETVDPNAPVASATISFADVANRTTFTTSQQVWVANGITVTNNKSASTSNVADYSNPARFYASSELVIEYKGMTKIVFNLNAGKPAAGLTDSLTGVEGITVTADGNTVTVEFASAVDSFTVAKLAAQIRVDSIEVYN
ncbi:MAG: hypothetical protein IKM40_03090 [Clostridia bacterium]|nr:hypothetical protein [Clostridia bacterium]